jgi:hypothetical protein
LLVHPSDTRTGLRYSLRPMTRSIIGGCSWTTICSAATVRG